MGKLAQVAAIATVLALGCTEDPERSGSTLNTGTNNNGAGQQANQTPDDMTPGGSNAGDNAGDPGGDAGDTLPSGPDAGGSDVPSGDSGDDPSTPGNDSDTSVSCGGAEGTEVSCSLKTKSCCVTGFSSDAATCVDGTSCSEGSRTQCDGPEDCGAGSSCCVDIIAGTSQCVDSLECPIFNPAQMCHTSDDCPDAKPDCTRGESDKFAWWGNCT